MNQHKHHYIDFKRWACGITDAETEAKARLWGQSYIRNLTEGVQRGALKRIKSDSKQAVAQRLRMRQRRKEGK